VLVATAGRTGAGQGRTGAALFADRCADCHGADATGISGPDLTRLWTLGRTDDQVFRTIRAGVPGTIMPPSSAPDEDVQALVAYLKSIGAAARAAPESSAGSADHGQQIFRSACASCHRVNQRGGRLGPDLSRIAETRSRVELGRAVREPDAAIAPAFKSVTIVSRDGAEIRGVRKGEDAFSIQVMDTRERLQGYLKADLREVRYGEGSLMPAFGPDRLSDGDLDDLLRFLGTLRRPDAK
jgi:putative heme-binding domain-containing protein